MTFARREFLKFAGAATAIAAISSSRIANSQPYPARAIRVIVPVAAGGAVDVATSVAAKAPSDGHTALTVTTSLVINPGLYANLPYDPVKDFAPITLVGASPHVLVVYPALAATNVNELVSLVRNNPG